MIRFANPVSLADGVDQEELEAICQLLREQGRAQIDGYGEDISPKDGFETRFDATLKTIKKGVLGLEDLEIDGYFSPSQTYSQPFTCWVFFVRQVWDDTVGTNDPLAAMAAEGAQLRRELDEQYELERENRGYVRD